MPSLLVGRIAAFSAEQRMCAFLIVFRPWLPRITKDRHDVLFVGDPKRSARFKCAVDLEIYRDNGLLKQTISSKDGRALEWMRSPRWNSSLRSCRAVLDDTDGKDRRRLSILRTAIVAVNPGLAYLWP